MLTRKSCKNMEEVLHHLRPSIEKEFLRDLKGKRSVKRNSLGEGEPGERLYVRIPKLYENILIVPGTLSLIFNIDLTGGHENNFLVQNVSRALVKTMRVNYGDTVLELNSNYSAFKLYEDLFLRGRENRIMEGIQSEDLCKIRAGTGDKKTTGVAKEELLEKVHGKKYRIPLDHQILNQHGMIYPWCLNGQLIFEIVLAPESEVIKGPDPTKLKYKLTNINLEYECIENQCLVERAKSEYKTGKTFMFDRIDHISSFEILRSRDRFEKHIDLVRRSMKALIFLFEEKYMAGTRDSEKFVFPDITRAEVLVNSKYSNSFEMRYMWREANRFFQGEGGSITMTDFYAGNRFALVIDLRTIGSRELENMKFWYIILEIKREVQESGKLDCHVFAVSDAQFRIIGKKLDFISN